MDKDATREGVLKKKSEGEEEVIPKIDTSSLDFMEQIAQKNEEKEILSEQELADQEGRDPAEWAKKDPEEIEAEAEKEAAEAEAERERLEREAANADKDKLTEEGETPPPKEEGEIEYINIKVDGIIRQVPKKDIEEAGIRTLQKESAADKRLEEATKALNEVREVQKQLSELDTGAPLIQAQADLEKERKELREEYLHQLDYGTPEEVDAALKNWEESLRKTVSTPETKAQPYTQEDIRTAIKVTQLEDRVNASPEKGGFADLMSDPILKKQTGDLVDTLVSNGQGSYDSFDTYAKAAAAVRAIGASLVPGYKPPETVSKNAFDEKGEKKKTIDNLKPASEKVKIPDTGDDGEQSASDIIQEMKAKRGQ